MRPQKPQRQIEQVQSTLQDYGIDPKNLTFCPKCRRSGLVVAGDRKSWTCSLCNWGWNLDRAGKMIYDIEEIAPEILRYHQHGVPEGSSTGWPDLDELVKFRRGEWTMVTGWASHGKSQFMDAVMVNLATQGWKIGIFSPENIPYAQHVRGLMQKVAGKRFRARDGMPGPGYMDRDEVLLAREWLKQRIFFVDVPEPTFEQLLAQFWKLVKLHDIQCAIIDPWNEIEHDIPRDMNETQYVAKVLIRFRDFCKAAHIHGFIVAHPNKGAMPKKVLGKGDDDTDVKRPLVTLMDISGSSHFENKAFNGISVWRNPGSKTSMHENHVYILKHRTEGVGGTGKVVLTWDPLSTAYHSDTQFLDPTNFPLEKLKKQLSRDGRSWREFAQRMETDYFLKIRALPWERVPEDQSHFKEEYRYKDENITAAIWAEISSTGARAWWGSIESVNPKSELTQEYMNRDQAFDFCEEWAMDMSKINEAWKTRDADAPPFEGEVEHG